jgi:hypothetical protein
MEYKYLLELLKSGLAEEFYAELKNTLVPFQPAQRYGRNILENSSFIVSSAFADTKLHGNGFVARLSGSTAEFISIWLLMNCGPEPFFTDEKGCLALRFSPILAGWLFDRSGRYSFNFLSYIRITYINPSRRDTFGKNGVKVKKISLRDPENNLVEASSDTLLSPYAVQVRERRIKEIEITLG